MKREDNWQAYARSYPWAPPPYRCWVDAHEQANYLSHMADPVRRKQLASLGWDSEDSVIYEWNRFGFRAPDIPEHTDMLCLGCSLTFGHGLPQHLIWPDILSQQLGVNYVNLGMAGCSPDGMFRVARFWIPELRPHTVVVAETYGQRWEICELDQDAINGQRWTPPAFDTTRMGLTLEPITDGIWKKWMCNSINHELHLDRARRAIQQLCAESGSRVVFVDAAGMATRALESNPNDLARDLMHPGKQYQADMAAAFARQLEVPDGR